MNNKSMSKCFLVTGSAGFIGSNFVRFMLERHDDIKIVSLDKLTYAGNIENLDDVKDNPKHIFIEGDICNSQQIGRILKEHRINTIVHFAAESHVDNSIKNPKVFLETNILGTYTLLEEARKFWLDEQGLNQRECRFHHVSTDEVYGSLELHEAAFTEQSIYQPNSPYSASKASSDHIVRSYYHTYNLPVTTSNCSNNYGQYQHCEKLIPTVIRACIEKNPIPVYGDGTNIRDWLYVDDHCDAIDLILRRGVVGEVYNIGGDNEHSNLFLIKSICQLMDDLLPNNAPHDRLIQFIKDRKGHDKRYAIDNTKIQRELGWSPQRNFIDNLMKTINYYRSIYC